MTKTPEELAEEYATFGTKDEPDSIRKRMIIAKDKMAFLAGYKAGYQAAKEQLADADKVMGELSRAFDQGYQSAKAHYQTDWISVKDRLPEIGQRVLIYNPLEYVSIVMADYYNVTRPFFDYITLDDIHLTIYPDEEKQLYWMPLLKPPEE